MSFLLVTLSRQFFLKFSFFPSTFSGVSAADAKCGCSLFDRHKKHNHITPVLASALWLPVCFRIDFKISMFVFKILNGPATQYLVELIHVFRGPYI